MNRMKKQTTFGLICALSLLLFACGTTKEMSAGSKKIAFETIHTDILSGGGYEGIEESIIVCNTQAELDALKERMKTVDDVSQFTENISVDFKKESVIAYFQPVRSSGGYGLYADSLISQSINGNVANTMHFSVETPKGPAIMILTQPYVFVKTKKMNGSFDFVVTEK